MVFGRVQDNIMDLRKRIAVLQDYPQDDARLHKERALQVQLDDFLKKEEFLWKEKSKEKWMEDGDQNSKYFHVVTVIRRRYNHIHSIQNGDQPTATSFAQIGQLFQDYFGQLFSSSAPAFPEDLDGLFPNSLTDLDCAGLTDVPTTVEIRQVVFSMSNGKSPGPDGLSSLFYKFYWDIV